MAHRTPSRMLAPLGLCVVLMAFAQASDLTTIDSTRSALARLESRLTPEGVANLHNILSQLLTLKKQLKPGSSVRTPGPASTPTSWTFTANPTAITAGQSSVLSFTTSTSDLHNTFINAQRPTFSCGPASCTGSLTVSPVQSTTYALKSTNAADTAYPVLSVTVGVTGTVPTPAAAPAVDPTPVPPPTGGSNAYFDKLVARPDFWKAYSFRDPKQLTYKNQGGYSVESSTSGVKLWVTYDAAMDAAKVLIPPFMPGCLLTAPVSATDTSIPLSCGLGGYWNGGMKRGVRVEQEIMAIVPPVAGDVPNTLTVIRGSFGTKAATHASGTNAEWNTNSLQSQVRVPLGTTDGSSYLFSWDALWTDAYLNSGLSNHKAFQFGSDGIWFEPQTGFDGARKPDFRQATGVAVVTARTYNWIGGAADWSQTDGNAAGPGVLTDNYITPRLAMPTIAANRWTRFWVVIEQRANDYEKASMWVADEQNAPVQVYKDLLISVRPKGNTIKDFWLEFNTSTDSYVRGSGARDYVSYVKNFVALKGAPGTDWAPLLQQPVK